MVMVTPASLSDRDAAKEILFRLRLTHPEITIVRADSAYAGKLVTWAKRRLNLTVKTISRPKDTTGFVVLGRHHPHHPPPCPQRHQLNCKGARGKGPSVHGGALRLPGRGHVLAAPVERVVTGGDGHGVVRVGFLTTFAQIAYALSLPGSFGSEFVANAHQPSPARGMLAPTA